MTTTLRQVLIAVIVWVLVLSLTGLGLLTACFVLGAFGHDRDGLANAIMPWWVVSALPLAAVLLTLLTIEAIGIVREVGRHD